MDIENVKHDIFNINSETQFNEIALRIFRFQYENNPVYAHFCNALGKHPGHIDHFNQIPFLPVGFFKNHRIVSGNLSPQMIFSSSGTTGQSVSRHYVCDVGLYERSFTQGFRMFLGNPRAYHILALLPSYLEREGSSLIYMVNHLIQMSNSPHSGFYLNNLDELSRKIETLQHDQRKILLIGVSFALLDLVEKGRKINNLMIMETGGMKGRRKELVREELHHTLISAFGVSSIYSEYGMTELLSQAWSLGNGVFQTPPWMKVVIRDVNDPLSLAPHGRSGQICIIDLANLYSCAFIGTQDLGKMIDANSFEVMGRFDHSELRGCNLMVE